MQELGDNPLFRATSRPSPAPPVPIGTAADTPYARLVEVLDSASRAGIGRISLLGAGMEE